QLGSSQQVRLLQQDDLHTKPIFVNVKKIWQINANTGQVHIKLHRAIIEPTLTFPPRTSVTRSRTESHRLLFFYAPSINPQFSPNSPEFYFLPLQLVSLAVPALLAILLCYVMLC